MSKTTNIEISTELLRRLHRIHRQRTDLTSRLERGPRQIRAGEAMVSDATEKWEAARHAVKAAKMVSDEKQMQLKGREDRIKDLEAKLNTAASNREFTTLKEQIAADTQANLVLSDEVFETLETIDELEAAVVAAAKECEAQKEDHTKRVAEVEAKMTQLTGELADVQAQLAKAESEIPVAARSDYKRVTDAKGEDALAPVEDESCGGCYQTLTTQRIEQLRMSVLIHCPNCNAFLYFPENNRP